MKQLFTLITALLVAVMGLTGCNTVTNATTSAADVSFIIADHYFVRNDVSELPNGVITTQEAFERTFGMATVMGGLPTPINFKKQFAIAVSVPPTEVNTRMYPVALKQGAQTLQFTYHVEEGQRMSYTTQPMLLIVVDKKYEAPLTLTKE